MLRLPLLIYAAVIVLTPVARAADVARHICFSRDSGVWIANLDGTGAHRVSSSLVTNPQANKIFNRRPGRSMARASMPRT